MTDRKEYMKAYMKAWREANKDHHKATTKAWYEANKEQCKEYYKAYYEAHKEQRKAQMKVWQQSHKQEIKEYQKADVNSLGQTKASIRMKSLYILKKMNLNIPDYEIQHCFGYDDPSKFIYISKSLHLKIHQYLRDNNIDADSDHWMAIRDLVNSTDEFMYIKC